MGTEPDTESLALGESFGSLGAGVLLLRLGGPWPHDGRHGGVGAVPAGRNGSHALDHAALHRSDDGPVQDFSPPWP